MLSYSYYNRPYMEYKRFLSFGRKKNCKLFEKSLQDVKIVVRCHWMTLNIPPCNSEYYLYDEFSLSTRDYKPRKGDRSFSWKPEKSVYALIILKLSILYILHFLPCHAPFVWMAVHCTLLLMATFSNNTAKDNHLLKDVE